MCLLSESNRRKTIFMAGSPRMTSTSLVLGSPAPVGAMVARRWFEGAGL
jgi:hypothetical protein